jgi:hypothetical protein
MGRNRTVDPLAELHIASPCSARWEDMIGDDEVRLCRLCNLHVFNLSAMNREEAAVLLAADSESLCVRYFRRADGTVITKDCPLGQATHKRRPKITRRTAAVGVGALGVVAWALAPVETMGRVAGPNSWAAALHRAARDGELQSIRELLKTGIDIDHRDTDGSTPLMDAATLGQTEAVRLLLERGADPTITDWKGRDALHYAENGLGEESQKRAVIALLKGAAM